MLSQDTNSKEEERTTKEGQDNLITIIMLGAILKSKAWFEDFSKTKQQKMLVSTYLKTLSFLMALITVSAESK